MGWKIVTCEVCESSVIKYEGEEAECPHCGELLGGSRKGLSMPNKKCPECNSNDIAFVGRKEGEDIWECENCGNVWRE